MTTLSTITQMIIFITFTTLILSAHISPYFTMGITTISILTRETNILIVNWISTRITTLAFSTIKIFILLTNLTC